MTLRRILGLLWILCCWQGASWWGHQLNLLWPYIALFYSVLCPFFCPLAPDHILWKRSVSSFNASQHSLCYMAYLVAKKPAQTFFYFEFWTSWQYSNSSPVSASINAPAILYNTCSKNLLLASWAGCSVSNKVLQLKLWHLILHCCGIAFSWPLRFQ